MGGIAAGIKWTRRGLGYVQAASFRKGSQPHIPYPECNLIGKQLRRRAQFAPQKPLHILNAVIDGISVSESGRGRFDQAAVIFYIGE